jgi:hypothetical protein
MPGFLPFGFDKAADTVPADETPVEVPVHAFIQKEYIYIYICIYIYVYI